MNTTISFSGTHRVKLLADMFGSFSIFGICNRRPKLANQPRVLQVNDAVHYIVEENDKISAILEYAKDLGRLNVSVSYRPYCVQVSATTHPGNAPTELLNNAMGFNRPSSNNNNELSSNSSSNSIANSTSNNSNNSNNSNLLHA